MHIPPLLIKRVLESPGLLGNEMNKKHFSGKERSKIVSTCKWHNIIYRKPPNSSKNLLKLI